MCDPITAVLGAVSAVGSIAGAVTGADASSKAAGQISAADQQAATAGNNELTSTLQPALNNESQAITAGQTADTELNAGIQPGGTFDPNQQFTMQQFQQDPGYSFDLQQGSLALQRSAAANGTLMSGGTLKSLTNYSQGMASNEFQNAYNRWNTTRQQNFNNLAGVAGIGGQGNATYGAVASTLGQGLSGNTVAGITGAGAAQAAGTLGQANAINSGISGVTNGLTQAATLNALTGSQFGNTTNPSSASNFNISDTPNNGFNDTQE